MRFFLRSFSDPRGYAPVEMPMGSLPRTREESYVPWALTAGGDVVYAKTGEHNSWRGGGEGAGTRLRKYDSVVSQNRRRLAESALGMYALNYPALTRDGVGLVNNAIKSYLDQQFVTNRRALTAKLFEIGNYFYTDNGTGFGRISTAHKDSVSAEGVRRGVFGALATGRLDQKLSIHDAVGRKLLASLGGASQIATYNHWGPILRQDWFDDKLKRGRVAATGGPRSTTIGGIALASQAPGVGRTAITRGRGVDSFKRDLGRTRNDEADAYYDDVDSRNLLFGAGISGTTGTLLQAAFAFAGVLTGENLKQYVLGIVGYLVGGGMHSYHESMAVAQKAGLSYTPGSYRPSLPASFVNSIQYAAWRGEFYDIVELGATHWRNNAGVLPSHLNSQLPLPFFGPENRAVVAPRGGH